MSILTGPAIRAAIQSGTIAITPHDPEQIDQAGVTLHLHPTLRVCKAGVVLDVRVDSADLFDVVPMQGDGAFLLEPGRFYLGSTIERIRAPHHVVRVDGKSSPGRLSLEVHRTAGHVEPAFAGQITLEMSVLMPLRIPPGWPICQAVFHEVTGEVEAYTTRGSYADAGAFDGPQTSRSYLHKLRHVRQTP